MVDAVGGRPCMAEGLFDMGRASYLADIERAVSQRLAGRRLHHVMGVADAALQLALTYGVDPFMARAAGLLHDWDKQLPKDELWEKALGLGVVQERDERLEPLLHAWTAQASLPVEFPDLPAEVFVAVGRHTVGDVAMTHLDMVVYLADMIEPSRRGGAIDFLRAKVGAVCLEELFAEGCRCSLQYLLEGGRYVYPGGVDVWNAWCGRLGR